MSDRPPKVRIARLILGRSRRIRGDLNVTSPIRQKRRYALQATIGAALALVAALAPVDAPQLPEALQAVVGQSPVSAQTPTPHVEFGHALACPGTTVATGSGECIANTDACPSTPFDVSTQMVPDDHYRDFCVEHIINDDLQLVDPGVTRPCTLPADTANPFGIDLVGCTANEDFFSLCAEPSALGNNYITAPALAITFAYDDRQYGMSVEKLYVNDVLNIPFISPDPDLSPMLTLDVCRIRAYKQCEIGWRVSRDSCRQVTRQTWTCSHLDGGVPLNEFNTCYVPPDLSSVVNRPCDSGAPNFSLFECDDYVGNDFLEDPMAVECERDLGMVDVSSSTNLHWCEYDAVLLDVDCNIDPCPATPRLCLKRASGTGGCNTVRELLDCRRFQALYRQARGPDSPDDDLVAQRLEEALSAGCEPCVLLPFESPDIDTCAQDATGAIKEERFERTCYGHLFDKSTELYRCGATTHETVEITDTLNRYHCVDPGAGNLTWRATHASQAILPGSNIVVTIHNVPTFRHGPRDYLVHAEYLRPDPTLNEHELEAHYATQYYQGFRNPENGQHAYRDAINMVAGSFARRRCRVYDLPRFRLQARQLWPDNSADATDIISLFGPDALVWWDALPDDQKMARTTARGLGWWEDLESDEQQERQEALTSEVVCNLENESPVWCRWVPKNSGYYTLTGRGAWRMASQSGVTQNELLIPTSGQSTYVAEFGNYTETEPIGIAVHEVRVVSRSPTP